MKQDNQRQALLHAYLAGLTDGEGSFVICKDRKTGKSPWYYGSFRIGMTSYETIKIVRDELAPQKKIYVERLYAKGVPRKAIYRLAIQGNKGVVEIINKLLPYLKLKKPQAELLLVFLKDKAVKWKEWREKKEEKCRDCGRLRIRRCWDRCNSCYLKMRKQGIKPDVPTRKSRPLPKEELKRREEFYQKMKKLNGRLSNRRD